MIKELEGYDWSEAFEYGYPTPAVPMAYIGLDSFTTEDVRSVAGSYEGENDGDSWMVYGELNDGRWFYLEAWCDYTGWD